MGEARLGRRGRTARALLRLKGQRQERRHDPTHPQLAFQPVGALAAHDVRVNDACVVSCVDWYGNARPIFYRGRVFALLGYELVEGHLDGQGLREQARVHFLRPALAQLAR